MTSGSCMVGRGTPWMACLCFVLVCVCVCVSSPTSRNVSNCSKQKKKDHFSGHFLWLLFCMWRGLFFSFRRWLFQSEERDEEKGRMEESRRTDIYLTKKKTVRKLIWKKEAMGEPCPCAAGDSMNVWCVCVCVWVVFLVGLAVPTKRGCLDVAPSFRSAGEGENEQRDRTKKGKKNWNRLGHNDCASRDTKKKKPHFARRIDGVRYISNRLCFCRSIHRMVDPLNHDPSSTTSFRQHPVVVFVDTCVGGWMVQACELVA